MRFLLRLAYIGTRKPQVQQRRVKQFPVYSRHAALRSYDQRV